MACQNSFGSSCGTTSSCPDMFGCDPNVCPDFSIRRHDTKPAFKVSVEDCDGPLDLNGLVLEANMWAKGKLKKAVGPEDTYFSLADNIGFNQIMVGDVIIMDRVRRPEQMLVVGFDEDDYLVLVERGFNNTEPAYYKKGTKLRIMRMMNAPAQTEMILQDIQNIDGTTDTDKLTDSFLVYEWKPNDTCLPGCYWLEFKLLKLVDTSDLVVISTIVPSSDDFGNALDVTDVVTTDPDIIAFTPSVISVTPFQDPDVVIPSAISFTDISVTPTSYDCSLPDGVDWIRRFPINREGFSIKVFDSPTAEV